MKSYNDKSSPTVYPRDSGSGALTDENNAEERRIAGNYQNYDMNMRASMDEESIESAMGEQEPAAGDAPFEDDSYNKDVEGFGTMHSSMKAASMDTKTKSFAGSPWDAAGVQ